MSAPSPDYATDLPPITTARLRLRPMVDADAAALFALFREPEVARYWSSPAMTDEAQAHTLIREIREEFAGGTLLEWAVERSDEPGLIGTCTLAHLDRDNRRAEIGYALHPAMQGRGYMREALDALVAHAFDDLGLHRLEADVDPRNTPSLRALERLGFVVEGRLRDRWQVTGEVQDSLILGLLAPEWRARQDP
jgi:RimJ/RimL family protein N-acetyltransferase